MAKTTGNEPAKRAKQRKYNLADIERGLTQLALCAGQPTRASQQLGDIPATTLVYWRDVKHADRYSEIAQTVAHKVEDAIVQDARETAALAANLERQALEAAATQIAEGVKGVDPSQVAQRAATVKGINVDKLLQLTGRPTQVVEHRNADEVLRKLGTALPGLIVEGTATEIDTDTKQIEQGSTPSQPSALGTEPKH